LVTVFANDSEDHDVPPFVVTRMLDEPELALKPLTA
jgi:hypothetical protein